MRTVTYRAKESGPETALFFDRQFSALVAQKPLSLVGLVAWSQAVRFWIFNSYGGTGMTETPGGAEKQVLVQEISLPDVNWRHQRRLPSISQQSVGAVDLEG